MVAALALAAQLAVVARAPLDTAQGINFHAIVVPDTVYVGQQATYQVGVFIEDQLRSRLRRNPEFVPPDPQGMLAYEVSAGSKEPSTRRDGRHVYEVHVFERAFFPLSPGRYEVPSAELAYALPLSLSFFSREESHTLLAESLSVVARAPPLAGRPADYAGAVGDLTVATHLDSGRGVARVGDPLRLTVSVAGRGDVNLFPRPAVALGWASAVSTQERVRLDSTSDEVRGAKDFDWVLTPRDSGRLTVPPIRYPYFNPYTERYEIAVTAPESVVVAPGALAPADTVRADQSPPLPIRTVYRGAPAPPLYQSPAFFGLLVAGPLPALVLGMWRRPRRRRRLPTPAVALRILARDRRAIDAVTVRRLFVGALADRFRLPPAAFTDPGALSHALRRDGVTATVAAATESALTDLDRAAFGTHADVPPDVVARAYAAVATAAAEARAPRPPAPQDGTAGSRGRTTVLMLACALVGAAGWAGASDAVHASNAAREFMTGVAAYQSGDFGRAATYFAAVTERVPGASDAWTNAGTAAWAVGDTADAVGGWQRAARLEPLASDVREHLALVRAPQDGPLARVPRIPAPLAADAALGLWLVACVVAAWRVARRRPARSVAATACVLAALTVAWIGVGAAEAASARHLAVVTGGTSLYTAPALAAERASRLDAGDVARVVGTRGLWADVQLDGDREGWVESARLISLARR